MLLVSVAAAAEPTGGAVTLAGTHWIAYSTYLGGAGDEANVPF